MATSNQLPNRMNANSAELDGVIEFLATEEDLDWIRAFQSRTDKEQRGRSFPMTPEKRHALAERMQRLCAARKKARGRVAR